MIETILVLCLVLSVANVAAVRFARKLMVRIGKLESAVAGQIAGEAPKKSLSGAPAQITQLTVYSSEKKLIQELRRLSSAQQLLLKDVMLNHYRWK